MKGMDPLQSKCLFFMSLVAITIAIDGCGGEAGLGLADLEISAVPCRDEIDNDQDGKID